MKKLRSKTIQIDARSLADTNPAQWNRDTIEYFADKIVRHWQHNPIESVNIMPNMSSWNVRFKVEYVSRDSSATRYANLERIKEQLLMECI